MVRGSDAVLLALALGMVLTMPAAAKCVSIGNLQVSKSESEEDVATEFPAGITEIYALFDYAGASNSLIGVELAGQGLSSIVVKGDRYDGDGHAAVPISGTEVYRALVGRMNVQAEAAQANAKKAADQAVGRLDYLQSVQASVFQMGNALALLYPLVLPDAQERLLEDMAENVADLDEQVSEALDPALAPDELQAAIKRVKAQADAVVTSAIALNDQAPEVGGVQIPSGKFTLLVTATGFPAGSLDFSVEAARIFMPRGERN